MRSMNVGPLREALAARGLPTDGAKLVLKERFGPQRALGACVIVGGVVALRLG